MGPQHDHEPVSEEESKYGRDSEYSAGLHSLALAADAHREAVQTIMAENPGMTEAEARLEILLHVDKDHVAERRSAERKLQRDPSTGLGNETALQNVKAAVEHEGSGLAFISLDINNFGDVNKIYNRQEEGDKLILEVVAKMLEVMNSLNLPPRIFRRATRGDEFVIIAPSDQAEAIRDQVEAAVGEQTFTAPDGHGGENSVTISISGTVGPTLKKSQDGGQQRKQARKAQHGQASQADV
jgi:GGDEF domain-containing protein